MYEAGFLLNFSAESLELNQSSSSYFGNVQKKPEYSSLLQR